MIDLHLHLDGSLPPALLLRLAEMEGVTLPAKDAEGLVPWLSAPIDCSSLNEYLEKFELPVSCMQSLETIAAAAGGLVEELSQEGLVYAEIRFAPQQHMRKGLSQRQVVRAAVDGMEEACRRTGFQAGLILCCMRGRENLQENLETVRAASEFLGKGVCAVDLAGAEALFPTGEFGELFSLARQLSVPYTIHAGEADGPESIRAALSFGTRRIGHGVRCIEDEKLVEELKEKQTTLEVCVISNLQTKAIPEGTVHPILQLLRRGLRVTVNTDNMTVSQTTIAREFAYLRKLGMTPEEERQLLHNSADAAFLSTEKREELKERIDRVLA